MKILTVLGARPQFIKAAAVSKAISDHSGLVEVLLHTGQHYDANMSDVFFSELGIPSPNHHLGVGSGLHGAMTGKMMEGIERVAIDEAPDVILVYGDTNSTLAGALVAAKLHVPVAHVEAGLRSFNRRMPEEVNRVLTDHVSTWLFCPTQAAVDNLGREGIFGPGVSLVGDVMFDVALLSAGRATSCERFGLTSGSYVLATVHRAENTDDPARLRAILEALSAVADDVTVVLPLHPRTRAVIDRIGLSVERLNVMGPVGYLDMVGLERGARLIVTDSGGVQKEAFFHGVPCVTLRDETEWIELVQCGWNQLVPPRSADLVRGSILEALQSTPPPAPADLYGGGSAAQRIVESLSRQ